MGSESKNSRNDKYKIRMCKNPYSALVCAVWIHRGGKHETCAGCEEDRVK
jgi:hypothetical protein